MPPTPLVYKSGCRRLTIDEANRSETPKHFSNWHGSHGRSPSSSWSKALMKTPALVMSSSATPARKARFSWSTSADAPS